MTPKLTQDVVPKPGEGLRLRPRARLRHAPLLGTSLVLSPLEPADGPELWQVVDESRVHLAQWLPWVPYNTTPISSQRYVESCAADWDAGRALRFGIRKHPDGDLLGVVSLDNCVHVHRSCDLGYWLKKDVQGRGLMSEAARLALQFAFDDLGVHRVRCAAATDNHRSLAVIAKLRFQFEGVARHAEFVDNRWVDHAQFSRLSTDGPL